MDKYGFEGDCADRAGLGFADGTVEACERDEIVLWLAYFHAPSSTGAGRPASETILFRRSDPSEVILVDLFSLLRRAARCAEDSSEGIAPVAIESDIIEARRKVELVFVDECSVLLIKSSEHMPSHIKVCGV